MLEEKGTVIRLEQQFAWVETERSSSCAACVARSGCGTGVIAKVLGRRQAKVRAINSISADAGDRVVVGLAEDAMLQGSAAVYLAPLASMVVAAGLGEWFAGSFELTTPDLVSVVFGLLGLGMGFAWLRRFSRSVRDDARYQPVLIRRICIRSARLQ